MEIILILHFASILSRSRQNDSWQAQNDENKKNVCGL